MNETMNNLLNNLTIINIVKLEIIILSLSILYIILIAIKQSFDFWGLSPIGFYIKVCGSIFLGTNMVFWFATGFVKIINF